MHHHWAYFWDLWELGHKVTFDGLNKLITVAIDVTEIDIRIDLYSAWKEWTIVQSAVNLKWAAAFRSTGGDPLPGDEFLGRTFFLINGWRIVLDHGINFVGNLFTEEGEPPFVTNNGVPFATSTVSTLVVDNLVEATVTAEDISQAVWDLTATSVSPGSFGEIITQLNNATILETSLTTSGSTAESVNTLIAKADDYYNNTYVTIVDSIGNNTATRQIDRSFADGRLDLIESLPWTPSANASVIVLGRHLTSRGAVV